MDELRAKALEKALAELDKQFAEPIKRLSAEPERVEAISTSSPKLDGILGIGGIPKGRITEVFGPDGSGKTTLAYHLLANAEAPAYIDAEQRFDPLYARDLGVDLDKLLTSTGGPAEDVMEQVRRLCETQALDLIVIDSVAALTPRAELEGQMEDVQVGALPRLMSKALRMISRGLGNTALVFTNQLREKIGPFGGVTQPGGRALKFYSSVRIDLRRIENLGPPEEPYGQKVRAKTVKNSLAPPYKQADLELHFGTGISKGADLLDAGLKDGSYKQSGAWIDLNGKKVQGRQAAIASIESAPSSPEQS